MCVHSLVALQHSTTNARSSVLSAVDSRLMTFHQRGSGAPASLAPTVLFSAARLVEVGGSRPAATCSAGCSPRLPPCKAAEPCYTASSPRSGRLLTCRMCTIMPLYTETFASSHTLIMASRRWLIGCCRLRARWPLVLARSTSTASRHAQPTGGSSCKMQQCSGDV